jgi:hypothetical protein
MEKRFALCFLLCLSINAYPQFIKSCYNFETGIDYSKAHSKTGFVVTAEDFLNHNILEVTRWDYGLGFEDNYTYELDGVTGKMTIEEMAQKYFGYVENGQLKRIYLVPAASKLSSPKYRTTNLTVFGKVCLWGGTGISNAITSEDGIIYTYTTASDTYEYISIGIKGEIMSLTNENFAKILGEFDSDLQTNFLQEAEKSGIKMKRSVTYLKDYFRIFVKYYEAVNKLEDK